MDDWLRRGTVNGSSARSMLLTVLGEYVAPEDRAVYRDGLVRALETSGYTTSAARQALARSVAAGWLESTRVGRRSRMRLTRQTHAALRAGYPRIYGFGRPSPWSGDWLLIVMRVPEERREVRDRLRTQLSWAGFGSLGGGVWISPHVDRATELQEILEGHPEAATLGFRAEKLRSVGDLNDVIAQAWNLPEIRERYHEFLRSFESLVPSTPRLAFKAQTSMVHSWGAFPFIDPDLPEELLPAGWPRAAARRLFVGRHAQWREAAEGYFNDLSS